MTDPRTSDDGLLESRLRPAGAAFPRPGVPDGAWQDNQRRLLARSSARRGPDRRLLLVAAAVVIALVLGGGVALLGGTGGRLAGPPAGGDDPFGDSVILGPPVEAETLQVGDQRVPHEAAFSDMTGEGPSLCDRPVSEGSASGGCTRRDPAADDPDVAFDWFTGPTGGGDIRGASWASTRE